MTATKHHYTATSLQAFCSKIFEKTGCSSSDAEMAAKVLIAADLRGVDSHGIARLKGYVRLYEAGRVNTSPDMQVVHETPSTGVLDADRALGLNSGNRAMQIAVEKARNVGTGWVAVKNSNHFGIAGYHAMTAMQEDMIGIAMTNASPLVAPTFSIQRMLGTNPVAVAIPAGQEDPFVADFATTTAANGKLEILQRENKEAPSGWVQDQYGNDTTDPYALKNGGSLLPLGGDRVHGSHKGYCMGAIVDIFSALLSGANYGPWAPPFVSFLPLPANPVGEGLGHFFGAMRVDAFRPLQEFKAHMDNWIQAFRNADAAGDQKVLIPGDQERHFEAERKKNGIPLNENVVNDLMELSEKYHIPFP